jgi:hypothetical protein
MDVGCISDIASVAVGCGFNPATAEEFSGQRKKIPGMGSVHPEAVRPDTAYCLCFVVDQCFDRIGERQLAAINGERFKCFEYLLCERVHTSVEQPKLAACWLFGEHRDLIVSHSDRAVAVRFRALDN